MRETKNATTRNGVVAFVIPPRGLEPKDVNDYDSNDLENQPIPSAAKSAALSAKTSEIDPELQTINEAWPTLPEPLRAAVLAIVRSSG